MELSHTFQCLGKHAITTSKIMCCGIVMVEADTEMQRVGKIV